MKTASTGSLTVLVAAALLSALTAVPGAADSIGTVYDMDRMLSEPHPLANQYGTRWQAPPPPSSAPAYAPGAAPSPFPATAPEPPPTTFAPPAPPPFGKTAPPLPQSLPPSQTPSQPAPHPQPVAKVTPVESLAEPATQPLEMAPRLSIDAEGVDLEPEAKQEPEKTEPEVMEKAQPEAVEKRREREFEQPGPRPPLPPG